MNPSLEGPNDSDGQRISQRGDRLVDSFDCDGTEAEYETIEISDTVTVLREAG